VKAKYEILHKLPFFILLRDINVSGFLNMNTFEGKTYFSKESFEELVHWLHELTILKIFSSFERASTKLKVTKEKSKIQLNKQTLERILLGEIKMSFTSAKDLLQLAEDTGYDVDKFTNKLIKVKKKNNVNRKDLINAS